MGGRKTAGLSGALLVAGSIASALSRWYLVWLAQELNGPEGLGVYGMLFAVATPLFVGAQLGLRIIFLSKQTAFPWRSFWILRIIGLAIGSVTLIIFILLNPAIPIWLGIAVLSMKIFDAVNDLNLARIQYTGRIFILGILSLCGAPLAILFATIGALATQSLSMAVAGAALAALLIALVSTKIARGLVYETDTDESGMRSILRSSSSVTSAEILASLLLYLPVWFLSFSADLKAVGIFAGISYVLTAADLIGSSISALIITPLRNVHRRYGSSAVIRRANALTLQFLFVSILGGLLLVAIGSPLFQWIYGPEFEVSLVVLGLFAAGCVFVVLSHIQSVCLNVLNSYLDVTASFGFACGVSLITGLVLAFFSVDSLIIGSAMVACGSFGRTTAMVFGVAKARAAASGAPTE